jgi:hypothetical protein
MEVGARVVGVGVERMVGASVRGSTVGKSVGVAEGARLGDPVEPAAGLRLGERVGIWLGASVGTAVGLAVITVGGNDGAGVRDGLNTEYVAVNPGPEMDESETNVTRMTPYLATKVCWGRLLPENEPMSI